MDAKDLTPEQLRAIADEMEARGKGITSDEHERRVSAIRGGKPYEPQRDDGISIERMRESAAKLDAAAIRADCVRHVVIDGIPLDIDMRMVSDIRTMRMIGEIQKGGEGSTFAAVELFDRILGDQREAVEDALSDADGYCPADAYCEFAVRIFEAVGAKN